VRKNVVIVSTYPEHGSKNIGDRLITNKLKELLSEIGDYSYKIVWRAAPWAEVKDIVLFADHVFFACLAIRPNMHIDEYPYLTQVAESGVPFSVISAGTDLKVSDFESIFKGFSEGSIRALKLVNERAVSLTTRGYLSQEFCLNMGLKNFKFSGDVAFYNRVLNEPFISNIDIKKIVISDPHRAELYIESFVCLHAGLRNQFPRAEIVVAQHGVNNVVDTFCKNNDIKTVKIYERPDKGLEIYDNADLHVGFRVHAHVSALSRKVYSYLLEQDGRGCDYGLTLNRKISVPCYKQFSPRVSIKGILKFIVRGSSPFHPRVSISAAQQILSIIRQDSEQGFLKFEGLENQISGFTDSLYSTVRKSLAEF
jgi:hypothetical protein